MNRIYKIAKRYGKGTRARTCAAAFLAAFALTGVMGMSEAQAYDVEGNSGQIGGVVIYKGIYYKNTALRDGSLYLGDTSGNYSQITPKSAKLGQVTIDDKGYITGANYVQTNALNSKYNFSVGTAADNGTMPFFVNSTGDFYAANNKFSVNKDGKVTATAGEIGGVTVNKGLISNGAAKIALYGDSGVAGMVNGKGASIYMQDGNTVINSKVAIDKDGKVTATAGEIGGVTINKGLISNGAAKIALYGDSGVAGMVNGKGASIYMQDGNTVINSKVAIDKDGKVTATAGEIGGVTLDKGLISNGAAKIALYGDSGVAGMVNGKGASIYMQDGNTVINSKVAIDKDGKVTATAGEFGGVTINKGMISNGAAKIALYGDSGVAGMVNGKGASIYMQDGNTVINSKVAIDKDGKVTGVAAGAVTADSKDAVNGGQLYATNQLVKDNASNISLLSNSIDKLDNRVDKVGAGAAALAALHPLDFDPEDKWDFAAGYGNYSGSSAVALGAYYRPNEDTMFSVGGSFGNGENMVNAGVSLKLGQSSHAPASKAAMEKKISSLSQEVEELKAAIADLRAAQTKAKDAQKK
jgi:urease gamma subunit